VNLCRELAIALTSAAIVASVFALFLGV